MSALICWNCGMYDSFAGLCHSDGQQKDLRGYCDNHTLNAAGRKEDGCCMITLSFYEDGCYVKGHDIDKICSIISYGMWSCISDCLECDKDVWHYESGNDKNWDDLGFTYIKINKDCDGHKFILGNFKNNISKWIREHYSDRVKIIDNANKFIEWGDALMDAKQYMEDFIKDFIKE